MEAWGWDVSSLALPAFLASAASTLSLQEDIPSGCACSDHATLQAYLSEWSSWYGTVLCQTFCRRNNHSETTQELSAESSLTSPSQSASFMAASSPHSGDWLFALPITSCGLRLDDEAVRIAVASRLGMPLCAPRIRAIAAHWSTTLMASTALSVNEHLADRPDTMLWTILSLRHLLLWAFRQQKKPNPRPVRWVQ